MTDLDSFSQVSIRKRHYKKDRELKMGQVWALAEIAAYALCSLGTEWKKFWPWDNWGYTCHHNYPQIAPLQKKLKRAYMKQKNFNEYILAGIKLVEKHKNIKP